MEDAIGKAPASSEVQSPDKEDVPFKELCRPVIDRTLKCVIGIGLASLVALAFSPFLQWMNILPVAMLGLFDPAGLGHNLGGLGIHGPGGKIVLCGSLLLTGAVAAASNSKKCIPYALAAAAAWGTVAVFWMAGLIYIAGNIANFARQTTPSYDSAVFQSLSSVLVTPGAGLYIGLMASLVATACFMLAERRTVQGSSIVERHGVLGLSQALAIEIGVGLIIFYQALLGQSAGPGPAAAAVLSMRAPASHSSGWSFLSPEEQSGQFEEAQPGPTVPAPSVSPPTGQLQGETSPHLTELSPFIVELANHEGRYLKIIVAFECNTAQNEDALKSAAVRDAIIEVLTSKTSKELVARAGKIELKSDIIEALSRIPELRNEVSSVYFTDFQIL